MEIKRVCALYFSATGNTEKTVAAFAETLAEQLGIKPTSAEPRTASVSLPRRNCSIADSPKVSRTATRISVTRKMNTDTCTVCEIALRMIDRTGAPSWE